MMGEAFEGVFDAFVVGVHGVGGEGEGGDVGVAFDDAGDGGEVGGDEVGDLGGEDADEGGMEFFGGGFDVVDEFVVAAEDGVVFGEGGDEEEGVGVVPAGFVVGGVGGVAAGGVVDDDHAAEFEEGCRGAEGVGGGDGEEGVGLGEGGSLSVCHGKRPFVVRGRTRGRCGVRVGRACRGLPPPFGPVPPLGGGQK